MRFDIMTLFPELVDTVLSETQRLGGISGIHPGTDSHQTGILQDLQSRKDSGGGVVAGVVVRHQSDIEFSFSQKSFATGFHQQIGTAFGDGIRSVGNDSFPLDDTQIRIFKSRLDTREPAKPAMTWFLYSLRTLCAVALKMVFSPMVTWPSPAMAILTCSPAAGRIWNLPFFSANMTNVPFLNFFYLRARSI